MATPLAHSLAGYAIYRFGDDRQGRGGLGLALLALTMANAADLDFLPGLVVGKPALYHQGISHSLGIALLVSVGSAVLFRRLIAQPLTLVIAVGFFAYVSHLVIDMLGPDLGPPYGIPLFWPISGVYVISPIPIFLGVRHAISSDVATGEWLASIFSLYNLGAFALDIALLTPLAIIASRCRRTVSVPAAK
jgi:inner membrane protein